MVKNTSKKLCPSYKHFFEPTLKALDILGGSGSNEEIYKKVLEITNLSKDVVEEMHTVTMSEVEYKLMWARTYLKNFVAIESSKQGVWALTVKGAQLLKSGKINTKEITLFTNKNFAFKVFSVSMSHFNANDIKEKSEHQRLEISEVRWTRTLKKEY